jgi:hypothetical protein
MRVALRSALVTVLALAALVAAGGATAAPASTSFAIVGYEYAFTSTVGSFAGTGHGDADDTAAWNARVEHDPLGSTPTYVNGGSFAITTRSPGGHLDFAAGDFAYHGGTITTIDPGAGCTNQRYGVTGTLENVATTTTSGGSGDFAVTLTHYRVSLLGHCVIYKARVAGTVSFSYRP